MRHLLLRAHVLDGLRALSDESIHCVVTSPPYFGLRDYKTPATAWGDGWRGHLGLEPTPDLFIAHLVAVFREVRRVLRPDGTAFVVLGDSYARNPGRGVKFQAGASTYLSNRQATERNRGPEVPSDLQEGDLMGIPWRFAFAAQADGWLLRSGIVWSKRSCMPESMTGTRWERHRVKLRQLRDGSEGPIRDRGDGGYSGGVGGIAAKPYAEWADCPSCERCSPNGGLILRRGSWRPTSAHEYIFMLAKSDGYFADGEELREQSDWCAPDGTPLDRYGRPAIFKSSGDSEGAQRETDGRGMPRKVGANVMDGKRNLRSVWELGPEPFADAHFATFPSEIPRRCILAGTSSGGCCAECGAPLARVVDRTLLPRDLDRPQARRAIQLAQQHGLTEEHIRAIQSVGVSDAGKAATTQSGTGRNTSEVLRLATEAKAALGGYSREFLLAAKVSRGFLPTCPCGAGAGAVPSVVLDPFVGSGTTGDVALALGRRFVGIDLSAEYLFGIARPRVTTSDVGASLAEPLRLRTIEGPLFS